MCVWGGGAYVASCCSMVASTSSMAPTVSIVYWFYCVLHLPRSDRRLHHAINPGNTHTPSHPLTCQLDLRS